MYAARDCYEGYVRAKPEVKKLWNQAFIEEILVRDRQIVGVTWAEPFHTLTTARRGVSNKRLSEFGTRVPNWLRELCHT